MNALNFRAVAVLAVLAVSSLVHAQETQDVVDVALASKDHTILVKALKAADYVQALRNPGPFTVFAPTDAAFAKLPRGTLEQLMKSENVGDLEKVLQYHVTPATYLARDLKDGMTLGQVNGKKITIQNKNGKLTVNGANVIASVRVSNGIVHVIDAVLVPPASK